MVLMESGKKERMNWLWNNKKDFSSQELEVHECRLSPFTPMKAISIPKPEKSDQNEGDSKSNYFILIYGILLYFLYFMYLIKLYITLYYFIYS
jgi:hypothetical protein